MKRKSKEKLSALKSARVIKNFIEWARTSRDKKSFNDNLAATFIYANLSEFIAESFLDFQRFINKTQSPPDEQTNLEHLISELEKYDFFLKEKVVSLLYKIKDQRNKLFHNLVTVQDKGLHLGGLMKNIQNDTETLIGYWGNFLDSFFKK